MKKFVHGYQSFGMGDMHTSYYDMGHNATKCTFLVIWGFNN